MIRVSSNGEATITTNYRDTVYDALASANRIGRANQQAILQLQSLIVFGIIMVGILLIRGRK